MLRPGSFIADRYEILNRVGSGGMSVVYKAKCHKLNRNVAIKILKDEYAADRSFVTKFKTEAQAVAGLIHPNIVNVYDVGEDQGFFYIVMEYIEGITLKQYIERKGQLAVKESVSIAIQVAQGIEAAHHNNVIHRDVKPQNILISREGKVKVTDFGIARVATENTIDTNTVGSVHYISPEQARGGFVDERTDIYSLGITLYEMVTGQVPFDGTNNVSIALKHIQEEMTPVSEIVPSVPISVERIIEKCTQKKPDRRYSMVSSLIADLKKSLIMPNMDFVLLNPENPEEEYYDDDEKYEDERDDFEERDEYEDDYEGEYEDEYDDEYEDEFEEDYEEEKRRGFLGKINPKLDRLVMIGGICAAAVVVIVIIAVCAVNFGGCGSAGKNGSGVEQSTELVEVPNVVGKNVEDDDVEGILTKAGFKVKFEYKEDKNVKDGCVISQSEEAGKKIRKGTKITVVVSGGKKNIKVSNVVGKSKEDAVETLKDQGFEVAISNEYSDDVPLNNVISTNPGAGQSAAYGSTITIVVSRGPEKEKDVTVPDLSGLTQNQAKAKLEELGLALGSVENSDTTDSKQVGKVVWQSVDSGSKAAKGTAVNIAIGKLVESKEKVPSVVEKTLETAKKEIQDAGFTVGNITEDKGSTEDYINNNNRVKSQTPAAGSMAEKKATIDLVIWVYVEEVTP